MANPNIVSVATINANASAGNLSTTSETSIVSNASSSGKVYKLGSLVVANTNGSAAATVTVTYHSAASLGGTSYPIASTISVPANATLIIIDKTTAINLLENTSLGITAGTANYLTFMASWDEIS